MVMLIIKIMFDELGLFWLIERDNFHTARASSKKKKKKCLDAYGFPHRTLSESLDL